MKKRILALLVSILTLVTILPLSFAAEPPTLTVSSAAAVPGEIVSLTVSASNNPGINTFALGFQYDTERLSLQDVTPAAALGGQFTFDKKAVWLNSKDSTYNGEILTLTFRVKNDAPAGDAAVTVTFRPGDIANYNEDDVSFTLKAGAVSVGKESVQPGGTISVSSAQTAGHGETVDLHVSIAGNPGINTFALGFVYDTERLTLQEVKKADALPGQFAYDKKAVWLNSEDSAYNGEILTLTFRVNDDAPAGEAAVAVTYKRGDIANYNEEDVDFALSAGSVTVTDEGPAPQTGARISVSSAEAAPGETVALKVSVANNPGFNTFTLGIQYDTERLTLQNVEKADALPGQFTYDKKAVWLNREDTTYNGEILTLTFLVNDNAPAGEAAVAVAYNPGDIANYNEINVDFALTAGVVTVKADDPTPQTGATLSVSSAISAPGETVSLTVSASNNPGINTFALGFQYDTDRLTLQDVTPAEALGGQFTFDKKSVWLSSEDTTYNGEILTLTFRVNDNAPVGNAAVSITYRPGDISNYNEENVDFALSAGSIFVSEASVTHASTGPNESFVSDTTHTQVFYTLGDVNMDGKINSTDARRVLRAAAKLDVLNEIETLLADMDGNAKINSTDARKVLRIAARLEPAPETKIPIPA